jgi:hypothetical protein
LLESPPFGTMAAVSPRIRTLTGFALVLLLGSPARAQSAAAPSTTANEEGRSIVFEAGWAAEAAKGEGFQARGATFAFEVTPVEDRLEIECGLDAIRTHGSTETSVDVLFKKPWTLSKTVEFMAGVGPELIHASGPDGATFWGLSAAADFMFWPKARTGWYLEPAYEVDFRGGTTRQGLSMAAGLIIAR